ncbi:MAG: hypothetical protein M3P40_06555 [Actinomycetota bacterium]|nr:hypothetical protein [Actinomycetota bacterium]
MTATNRLLLALVVTAAAVSAFWFLALTPKREQAAELQTQIDAQAATLQQTQAEIAGYERARAAYSRNYATLARLGKAVPADDDMRSLMIQLDSAAAGSGVVFESIDVSTGGAAPAPEPATANGEPADQSKVIPGAIANGAGFSTLPMTLSFKGSYFELSGFFARLERFVGGGKHVDVTGRLLTINNIAIEPVELGSLTMRAHVDATSYLVPEDQGITNGATASGPTPATPAPGAPSTGTSAPVTTATMPGVVR